jgi:MATE family multidrug resistance protein
VTVQVGMMLMGVADTMMVGRVSPADLAAVALGNLYFMSLGIFAMGVLFGLDPVISQAVGADDGEGVARGIQRGMMMAIGLATVAIMLMLPAGSVLTAFRQPADVVPIAAGYARAASFGMFPFLFYVVLRQTLQALGRLAPIVWTVLLANVLNLFLNWVFVFGHLGVSPMGAVGTGWASSLSRVFMFASLAVLSWGVVGTYLRPIRRMAFKLPAMKRMLRLGAPIGVQMSLEYWAFGATSLLMGLMGTVALAGHQVAINIAALTFMLPLGIGQACAVLVGRAVGRGLPDEARRASTAGLLVGVGIMCVTAVMFLLVPGFFARLYTSDVAVVALAAGLIPLAGVFQVFDGIQVVAAGALRGVGDTRAPMVINLMGFWVIGLPVGIVLGFRTALGPQGLWWGFVAGLGAVSVLLLLRVRVRFARSLERLRIDEDDGHDYQPNLPEGSVS